MLTKSAVLEQFIRQIPKKYSKLKWITLIRKLRNLSNFK